MRRLWFLMLVVGVGSCATVVPTSPTLPDPDTDPGLGDFAMMPWTRRNPDGLLGHVLSPGTSSINGAVRVVTPQARWSDADQHLTLVTARGSEAELEGGASVLSVGGKLSQVTHFAWDLKILGYLDLVEESMTYESTSNCCQAGVPAQSCGDWYVNRVMFGSGSVKLLRRLEVGASASAGQLLKARGGASFLVVNELQFERSFFGFGMAPLETLCSRVGPEQELTPLKVEAPDNCRIHAYLRDGTRRDYSAHYPDHELCLRMARARCADSQGAIDCRGTFFDGKEEQKLALVPPVDVAPVGSAGPASSAAPSGFARPSGSASVAP